MIAGAGVFVLASFAFADSTQLTTSCTASISGNVVTWTASTTGGNMPYGLLWSGNTGVAGSTSTSIMATYTVNGTYNSTITATDASSTIATGTCSAVVTSNVTPTPTSTLNVYVLVNNTAGGSAVPSNFTVTVGGAAATPSSFAGNASGTAVVVNASSTYTIGASTLANYTASASGNCAGPIAAGNNGTCTLAETYVSPSVTPTSTPRVNPPLLSVGENGGFLARGMTVTSVASGSFQAQVWGITYTVNWSGNLNNLFEFWFRYNKANATSTPSMQLNVGDEVGVAGKVSTSSPLVVNASVVRDYSITMPRLVHTDNGKGNGGENYGDTRSRLNDLLKQLKGLQDLFRGRFGGSH